MKTISETPLKKLLNLIKSNFFRKSESEEVGELSIDTTPTTNSENLVTSGGVKEALDSKLGTSDKPGSVYAVDSSRNQINITYANNPNAWTIAYRRDNGALSVGTPSADNDATTKGYVDGVANGKLNITGGTITGDLAVQGDLTVSGTTTTEHQKQLLVEDNVIVTNANKINLLSLLSGIAINKNADATYGIMYDPSDDTVKFGQGTVDENNKFVFNTGEGLPIAIRAQSSDFTDAHLVKWDATKNAFVDAGYTGDDIASKTNVTVNREHVDTFDADTKQDKLTVSDPLYISSNNISLNYGSGLSVGSSNELYVDLSYNSPISVYDNRIQLNYGNGLTTDGDNLVIFTDESQLTVENGYLGLSSNILNSGFNSSDGSYIIDNYGNLDVYGHGELKLQSDYDIKINPTMGSYKTIVASGSTDGTSLGIILDDSGETITMGTISENMTAIDKTKPYIEITKTAVNIKGLNSDATSITILEASDA